MLGTETNRRRRLCLDISITIPFSIIQITVTALTTKQGRHIIQQLTQPLNPAQILITILHLRIQKRI
jgi:hypothetical protein